MNDMFYGSKMEEKNSKELADNLFYIYDKHSDLFSRTHINKLSEIKKIQKIQRRKSMLAYDKGFQDRKSYPLTPHIFGFAYGPEDEQKYVDYIINRDK